MVGESESGVMTLHGVEKIAFSDAGLYIECGSMEVTGSIIFSSDGNHQHNIPPSAE